MSAGSPRFAEWLRAGVIAAIALFGTAIVTLLALYAFS